jgi:hypothetical protein
VSGAGVRACPYFEPAPGRAEAPRDDGRRDDVSSLDFRYGRGSRDDRASSSRAARGDATREEGPFDDARRGAASSLVFRYGRVSRGARLSESRGPREGPSVRAERLAPDAARDAGRPSALFEDRSYGALEAPARGSPARGPSRRTGFEARSPRGAEPFAWPDELFGPRAGALELDEGRALGGDLRSRGARRAGGFDAVTCQSTFWSGVEIRIEHDDSRLNDARWTPCRF